jgi:hypothetical protein
MKNKFVLIPLIIVGCFGLYYYFQTSDSLIILFLKYIIELLFNAL